MNDIHLCVKFGKFAPCDLRSRKGLSFISLMFMILLASSCLVSSFNTASPFALGTPDRLVKNETDLVNAINDAPSKTSLIITLDNDIYLSSTLLIPANKDITLTSNKAIGYYKLIGTENENTISINSGGTLKLDGIIITHENGKTGSGVTVDSDGTLIMYNGEISGNTVRGVGMPFLIGGRISYGGGVFNSGVFEMYGGKISDNLASIGNGGGVYNSGTFKLFGGEISNNNARVDAVFTDSDLTGFGGGVYNAGTFTMSGGKIAHNVASLGGGVYNYGTFMMSDGEISDNNGGGVYHRWYTFTMSGGKIYDNTAYIGGGVYVHWGSTFDRRGGVISGNTVTNKDGEGKDVYSYNSNDGSTNGNGSSSNGNDSSSNGNNGSSNGNNGSSNGNVTDSDNDKGLPDGQSFSLREVVIICIGVVGVTLAVVMAVLLFSSKKRFGSLDKTE